MEKIKKSFKKAFLPILIASILIMLLSLLKNRVWSYAWQSIDKLLGYNYFYSQSYTYILNGVKLLIRFIFATVECSLFCGVVSFCFARLNDEKANIGKLFYFFRSFKRIIMSFVVINTSELFSDIYITFKNLQLQCTSHDLPVPTAYTVGAVVSGLFYIVVMLFLYFWRYTYVESPESDFIMTLKKSCRCVFLAAPLAIIMSIFIFIYLRAVPDKYWNYLVFIYGGLGNWMVFTVYYMAISGGIKLKVFEKTIQKINEKGVEAAKTAAYNIGGSHVYTPNTSAENNEAEEEKPFIEPYDFFIEADERFNDEKIIETENIRGVDILAVLDEMNLADDVKIDLAIRKKLKKMFEELSFEIGEYVTYEGGREIENDFTEEIDERDFEVSVEITRNSDYEPFKLILRVNVTDNEE